MLLPLFVFLYRHHKIMKQMIKMGALFDLICCFCLHHLTGLPNNDYHNQLTRFKLASCHSEHAGTICNTGSTLNSFKHCGATVIQSNHCFMLNPSSAQL